MNHINKEVAFRYLAGIEHLFDTLAKSFLESYKDFNQNCQTAYESNDYELLHNHVHSLKGITLNIGMEELYNECVVVLTDIRSGFIDSYKIKKLQDVFSNTYEELKVMVTS